MNKEVYLAKARTDGAENITIKIEEELPSNLDYDLLYNSDTYFRHQAERLAEALHASLPYGTLQQLSLILQENLQSAILAGVTKE